MMFKQVVRIGFCLVIGMSLVGCHTTTQQTKKTAQKKIVPTRTTNITAVNPKSYDRAYKQFFKRAQEGDTVAAFNLGRMYADGRGVEVNDREAFHWFQKAAHKGLSDAKISLGVAYLFAKGTEKNSRQACKLFKQAMRQGEKNGKDFYRHYC